MGTVTFKRPPRRHPPQVPSAPVRLEPPPEIPRKNPTNLLMMAMPLMAGLGSMAFIFAAPSNAVTYLAGGLFMLSSVGMMSAGFSRGGNKRGQLASDRRDYLRYLGQQRDAARRVRAVQEEAAHFSHPEPGGLWAVAASPRLWERRPTDADFLSVRTGIGAQRLATPLIVPDTAPLEELDPPSSQALHRFIQTFSVVPDLPISVALRSFRVVRVRGETAACRSLARALVAQTVTLHAPDDVLVAVCASADAAPEWEWAKWLPHALHPTRSDAAGPVRLITTELLDLEDELAVDLKERGRFDRNSSPVLDRPHIIVIVDGGRVTQECLLAQPEGLQGTTVLDLTGAFDLDIERADIELGIQDDQLGVYSATGWQPFGRADGLGVNEAEGLARRLSPLYLSSQEETKPLLTNLGLPELLGIPDAAALDLSEQWRTRPERERLRLPIGVGEDGQPVVVDLKESALGGIGPHGLVIGATGSGKSELLRTLVLGLSLTHSPETLNFVLVDFKGGATFAGLGDLPHTAAVVTNLQDDLALVDRMKDALQGEMVRRQELIRAAGNYASVRDYERARASGAALDPLPSLLVIVDEFSELLSAKPDFIDLFVAIGRLGRSLGVHLLLASQRLEEGRLRGLESHLSYRVGLRTFSAMESRVVLGVPDAYELPSVPGSGYLKADAPDLVRFKAAYVSGRYRPRQARRTGPATAPHPVVFTAVETAAPRLVGPAPVQPEPTEAAEQGETVVDLVVDQLAGKGRPAHRVWLPPLGDPPTLGQLLGTLTTDPRLGLTTADERRRGRLAAPVGIVDRPFEQRREQMWVDLSGAGGHAAVVGAPQSGKSTLLRTLVASLALTHTPSQLQVYCVDFGGGGLAGLADLPHVAGVAGRLDPELVRRTVAEVSGMLDEREALFKRNGIDSMATLRAKVAAGEGGALAEVGDVFLVIDAWLTLRHEFEQQEAAVLEIANRGLGYGVHLIVSATRWAEIRPALRDLLGTKLELRLGDPSESEVDRRSAANVPVSSPGRGVTTDKHHFLAALPRLDSVSSTVDLPTAVRDLVTRTAAGWSGPEAQRVRVLPQMIRFDDLPAVPDGHGLPVGIEEEALSTVCIDPDQDPHILILGDTESGKTAALRVVAHSVASRFSPGEASIVAADYRRTLLGSLPEDHMIGYAPSGQVLSEMVGDIRRSLEKRLPGPDITVEQLRARNWWKGAHLWLLVDDYDLVHSASGNPLSPLADLLPHARDIGLHLVVARQAGGAFRGLAEQPMQRIVELRPTTFLLSGNPDEGRIIMGERMSRMPPGRAKMLTRRDPMRLVQLAWVEPA